MKPIPATDATKTSDADLVRSVAEGDTRAMGVLYERHHRRLCVIAARIVGGHADAEDMVHDLFASLPSAARLYRPERGAVTSWLATLVRNRAIDGYRARTRQRDIRVARLTPYDTEELDAEAVAASAALSARLERVLEGIGARHVATLRLVYVEGLSLPEVAEREKTPLGTIKSRAARGLSKLRSALGEAEEWDLAS
jgi:RNA polymerase sigma-70 factor (ECF subfamily)